MSSSSRAAAADRFNRYIERSNETHAQYVADPLLLEQYARYTDWLLAYLLGYFDELRSQPGYGDALNFVVSELAGVNVSARDRQLARAARPVTAFLPERALGLLAAAAKLNARTLEINLEICRSLTVDGVLPETIEEAAYFAACRKASSHEESIELLNLSIQLGKALVPTVNNRLIGMTLRAMKGPAHAAGFGDLQEFFESGYETFRRIPDVDHFLDEIERRMTCVFDRAFRAPSDTPTGTANES